MRNEEQNLIDKLTQKYHEFEEMGLKSYRAYLEKEFENSKNADNKKAYSKYIEKEIVRADNRLNALKSS